MTVHTAAVSIGNKHDHEFDRYLVDLEHGFKDKASHEERLFTSNSGGKLWEAYLLSFSDPVERQYHNCHCCQRFIETYGDLVSIDQFGDQKSAVWHPEDAPPNLVCAVKSMKALAERGRISSVFLTSSREWGSSVTGVWTHLHLTPPEHMIYKGTALTAQQARAEKLEDFRNVSRFLGEARLEHLEQAVQVLQDGNLFRAKTILGQAKWLLGLKERIDGDRKHQHNVIWRAVASAPAGFCHPRAGMIGTLMEDLEAGLAYPDIARKFAEKMDPLQYQRPQAAPTSGAIKAAEELVKKLGIERSLPRRYARFEEVQTIWTPKQVEQKNSEGVFGHLRPKGPVVQPLALPATDITFTRFLETVLPGAQRIEVNAPAAGVYAALVTAVNHDAPPILQWDFPEERNPVSWYFHSGGSTAASFNLTPGWNSVKGISLMPTQWGSRRIEREGFMLLIEGARDTAGVGTCLFQEILRSELHGVRSVIEAFSRSARMEGRKEQGAAGLMYADGAALKRYPPLVRVWSGSQPVEYRIDRWI